MSLYRFVRILAGRATQQGVWWTSIWAIAISLLLGFAAVAVAIFHHLPIWAVVGILLPLLIVFVLATFTFFVCLLMQIAIRKAGADRLSHLSRPGADDEADRGFHGLN